MLALRVHPLRRWLIPVTLATFSCEYMKTHFARQMDGLTSSASYMLVVHTTQAFLKNRAPLLPPCALVTASSSLHTSSGFSTAATRQMTAADGFIIDSLVQETWT